MRIRTSLRRWAILILLLALTLEAKARELFPDSATTIGLDPVPRSLVVADLDDDGVRDVLVAVSTVWPEAIHEVITLMGLGDGTFEDPRSFPVGENLTHLAAADLNGDVIPDAVVAADGGLWVLLGKPGKPGANFRPPVQFPTAAPRPEFVAIADVDGDTIPDLVSAGPDVNILLGNGDGTFQSAISLPAGQSSVESVAVSDLDGDTALDLVAAGAMVSVLLGNGDGTFQTPATFPIGPRSASAVTVADFDGDTIPDIATANRQSNDVNVLLGNGDGGFQNAVPYGVGEWPRSIAVAYLDDDLTPDLITGNYLDDDASVLLGNGDGTFRAAVAYVVGDDPISLAVADINGDSNPDLLTANFTSDDVSIVPGKGDGTFDGPVSVQGHLGTGIKRVALVGGTVADVNGDNIQDLIAVNPEPGYEWEEPPGEVVVRLGMGDRAFEAPVSFTVHGRPYALSVANLNGDTFLDIITANSSTYPRTNESVSVLLGNGDGTFEAAVPYAPGVSARGTVATGDLNGDTYLDLVVGNRRSELSVLLGNGDGSFQESTEFDAGGTVNSVAVGDLDGDAIPDVAVGAYPVGVGVFIGTGDGTLELAFSISDAGRGSVTIVDLNNDDLSDIVSLRGTDATVVLAEAGGTFRAPFQVETGDLAGGLAVADFDGDAVLDLVLANGSEGEVKVLLGNGDGTFASAALLPVHKSYRSPFSGPTRVTTGDVDGDGLVDIVASDSSHEGMALLFNQSDPEGPPSSADIEIDIKPNDSRNIINPSYQGQIRVAILGGETFDVSDVDATTLAFGPAGTSPSRPFRGTRLDINRDGLEDLVSLYEMQETGLTANHREACVSGETVDGRLFEGCQAINGGIACGIGFELVLLVLPMAWLRQRERTTCVAR